MSADDERPSFGIRVDGPPERWAGKVAALMVDRGRTPQQLGRFFRAVFYRR